MVEDPYVAEALAAQEPIPLRRQRFRTRWLGVVAGAVQVAGGAVAALLVAHVLLVLGNANPDNAIARSVRSWADALALGFPDLFTPADPDLRVAVNYGLAAAFWLVAASVLARILRRLASPYQIS
jgi:hypothetical protein